MHPVDRVGDPEGAHPRGAAGLGTQEAGLGVYARPPSLVVLEVLGKTPPHLLFAPGGGPSEAGLEAGGVAWGAGWDSLSPLMPGDSESRTPTPTQSS